MSRYVGTPEHQYLVRSPASGERWRFTDAGLPKTGLLDVSNNTLTVSVLLFSAERKSRDKFYEQAVTDVVGDDL